MMLMPLSDLSDLSDTQTGTCQRSSTCLEIARCLCRGLRTAGPKSDDLSRRSKFASAAIGLRHSTRARSASASVAHAVAFLAEGT
jgi:hypothetical protein